MRPPQRIVTLLLCSVIGSLGVAVFLGFPNVYALPSVKITTLVYSGMVTYGSSDIIYVDTTVAYGGVVRTYGEYGSKVAINSKFCDNCGVKQP